ncbi:hypothetical protein [Pontibacter vulgaris]|uniref:hypothetical protein n=1 Tax=Pontibacter vulgaris TaxID=2905679 RepID=UPI001FA7AA02|nr:hypothetical protein [Pontibacter vulgaris]
MIHMRAFLPKHPDMKLQELLQWSRLRQEQLSKAILITKDSVLDFLKRQLERGNWREVQEILKGKPMTRAGRFMMQQMRDNIVSNLIMRLGLRRIIAVGIAVVLIPLILAKVGGELMSKYKNTDN